ncbi:hypothetical protein BSR28_06995 [Boudabousia liubingyangii]|nr:hypothetical protein BSR28_06995 [Boudabousia liubingyangii]
MPAWALEKPAKYDPKNFPNTVEGKEAFAKYFLKTLILESHTLNFAITKTLYEDCSSCGHFVEKAVAQGNDRKFVKLSKLKNLTTVLKFHLMASDSCSFVLRASIDNRDGREHLQDFRVTVVSHDGALEVSEFFTSEDYRTIEPNDQVIELD